MYIQYIFMPARIHMHIYVTTVKKIEAMSLRESKGPPGKGLRKGRGNDEIIFQFQKVKKK